MPVGVILGAEMPDPQLATVHVQTHEVASCEDGKHTFPVRGDRRGRQSRILADLGQHQPFLCRHHVTPQQFACSGIERVYFTRLGIAAAGWVYTDLDGSANGYDPAKAGILEVTPPPLPASREPP